MNKSVHVFISVGEASGDMHAAAIIKELQNNHSDIVISGIAGPAMRATGCNPIEKMESLNVMGLGDVVRALPRIHSIAQNICDWIENHQPDVVILVDFPGFHMRLGERVRHLGIPVLYYIAPKLWAWGSWRIKRLLRAQDKLASILPFEKKWFANKGIKTTYVGNPSAFSCQGGWSKQQLKENLGVGDQQPLLAFLPGSRSGELKRHVTLLANVYAKMSMLIPQLQAVVPRAPGVQDEQLQPLINMGVKLLDRLDSNYALRADAAVAVSGTATLELALWDVPTVLIYKTSPLTMLIGRHLVGTRCGGLANILLGDQYVMPELLQGEASVENIVRELLPLIQGSNKAVLQRQHFVKLKELLGENNPAKKVAIMALEMSNDQHKPL